MDCKTFEQKLEAYLAGDLTPVERTEMEKHQTACAHCQRLADRATHLDSLLRDGMIAAVAMTPKEQVTLRESVLSQVRKTQPSLWWQWAPRLAGLAFALASLILAGLILPGRRSVPTVSAAEVITRAQAAMDERTGLSGVLHWELSYELWGPWSDDVFYYETEIWFDFDDPRRYHLHNKSCGDVVDPGSGRMVRDGIDRMWECEYYPERGEEGDSFVDEIILSPEEMWELASWHIPSPFRDDLTRFADILPDVEVVGETNVAGRWAYLLRGQLFTASGVNDLDETLVPVTSTVTLTVDAETYWLLGREEAVEGEARPRFISRTRRFELLAQDQVPDHAFTFTPPEDVEVRRLEGIDSLYDKPRLPTMALEEASDDAPFIFLTPTALPDDLEPPSRVLLNHLHVDAQVWDTEFMLIYRGKPGRQIMLTESMLPRMPALAARLVDVGDRQGWLVSDPIDSRQFMILLLDSDVAKHYDTSLGKWKRAIADPDDKLPPASVILRVWGFSVDEAIAVLASLEPYTP
jgi:hypothetical protein